MCGICGKLNLDARPIDAGLISAMAALLEHRGPDDQGVFVNSNIGLGHRRLKVIDLSASAHQPMSNEDGSIWIVYNGEIYNFLELKSDLEKRGHIFRSRSDTEVIIHLYEEEGVGCVKSLRGMFAFAIWDEKKKRLFLARDRVGKKPLNYAFKNKSFIFASEIKSILRDPDILAQVNPEALDLYLSYQCVPSPQTMFCGINKLPPAHTLVLENGKISIERYWDLSFQDPLDLNEEEICARIRELFTEACKIRMNSDVPLGAFLSGGIDSSAVVAAMSQASAHPVKTFSIGFKEQSFNELDYARRVAKRYHTEHHEYIVEPRCLEVLPKLVWHFNEPFADSSAIPTYYLAQITRKEVTVVLNGDGGDELFAGYERYLAHKIAGFFDFFPASLRKSFSAFVSGLPESTKKKDLLKNLKRFAKGLSLSGQGRYAYWVSNFDQDLKHSLLTPELQNRLKKFNPENYILQAYAQAKTKDLINSTLYADTITYLPNDLLVKVDITSMANSLEARSPFLDHKFMEFAARIPAKLKLKGLTTKYILKKALKDELPGKILGRKKAGFGVPIGTWFREDLKDYARDILLSQTCLKRGYFNKEALRKMLTEHMLGRVDHGQRIWSLINLELWHRMFIDGKN